MKYHAVLTIFDDEGNEITQATYHETGQFEMPMNNVIVHEFYLGSFAVPENKEIALMKEQGKIK